MKSVTHKSGFYLISSTLVGGSVGDDYANGMALDSQGNIYVVGNTTSSDFPTVAGSYRTTYRGGSSDGFVYKLKADFTGLVYSTFLGGSGADTAQAIALDNAGNAYITGYTASSNFPTTTNALRSTYGGGGHDAFVTKLNSAGSALVYSTYLGASGDDYGYGIAVDTSGYAYVTGSTTGSNGTGGASFSTTSGALRTSYAGGTSDGFVSKIMTNGTGLVYSTYLGGGAADAGQAITVDSNGYAYITGYTYSSNFPTSTAAYQPAYSGVGADVFMTRLNPAGSAVSYSTYLGGSCYEYGWGIALDGSNQVYITGYADSTDFPTTPGSIQPGYSQGQNDAIVAKFALTYLNFSISPTGTNQAGVAFPTQPVVKVLNRDGSTATDFNGPISLTIRFGTGTSGAKLNGTVTVNATNGVASFSGLSIDKVGTAYQLVALSGLLDPAYSAFFNVNLGGPASISVRGGGSQSALINTQFATPLQALVLDAGGNPVSGATVTFTAPSSGASGGFGSSGGSTTTTGTTDINGIATSSFLWANATSGTYNVTASVSGVATNATFNLTNTVLATGNISLHLDPIVAGPNVLSTTQILTATLKDRSGQPMAGQSVTFTVSNAATGALVTTGSGTTLASGLISFTYSSPVTATHYVTATVNIGGTQFQSNVATVYWVTPKNTVTVGTVYGSFFSADNSCYFNTPSSQTPLFTQNFPSLNFNVAGFTSEVDGGTRPFTNVATDIDGNYIGKTIVQGNGYQPGVGSLYYTFSAVLTGSFNVAQAGQVVFNLSSDDVSFLGIGNGAQRITSLPANIPDTTPFYGYTDMGGHGFQAGGATFTVNFPAAGTYPFELDYEECVGFGLSLSLTQTSLGNVIGPNGAISLTSNGTGPFTINQSPSPVFTATVVDSAGAPIVSQTVTLQANGVSNGIQFQATTNASGVVTFTYPGKAPGDDYVRALAWIKGIPAYSNEIGIHWNAPTGGTGSGGSNPAANCTINSDWLSSPSQGSQISGTIPIILASGKSIPSGTLIQYYPVSNPTSAALVTIYTTTTTINGPATLTNLDTTLLANGEYYVRIVYTDSTTNNCQSNLTLVKIVGEYKPGRVRFTVNDLSVPIVGLPLSIGRTYDSLERNIAGDFGYGWSLALGNPRLEVNAGTKDVTLTMPDGHRTTFFFAPQSGLWVLSGFYQPFYQPEAGQYGSLTSDGCGLMISTGTGYMCFPGGDYAPTTYTYTDPYGRIFTLSANGTLQSLKDLNGNTLVFTSNGITNTLTGRGVTFSRTNSNCPSCITQIVDHATSSSQVYTYTYSYDTTRSDLLNVTYPQPGAGVASPVITYSYFMTPTDALTLAHLFKTAQDPLNHQVVSTSYDSNGRLTQIVMPISASTSYTTTYAYSLDSSRTVTTTNPDNGQEVRQYDAYGKVLTETLPVASSGSITQRTTLYSYDTSHNLTQTILPNPLTGAVGNRTIQYAYDPLKGYQTAVTDTLNHGSSTIYNYFGGPQQMTDARGVTRTVNYDPNYLPTSVSDKYGVMGGYTFDDHGSILTRFDGNNKTTQFTYDSYGNKKTETDPLNNTTQYAYDDYGRVVSSTDALNNLTRYGYDTLGRLLVITNALGITTSYTYDANGNKTAQSQVVNGVVQTTRYGYDFANRLTVITYTDGITESYIYDWRGNKTSEIDRAGHRTNYTYDLAGQLIGTTYGVNRDGSTSLDTASVTYFYDGAGRKITETNAYIGTFLANPPGSVPTTQYVYDAADRLTTITNTRGFTTTYSYDAVNRRTNMTDSYSRVITYSYDDRGRLITTTYPVNYGGNPISTTLAYDGAGNVLTKTNEAGLRTVYSYDDANRLKVVSMPITQSQSYSHNITYTYNQLGQLVDINDGNNPTVHHTGFQYDPLGRLQKKTLPDGSFEQYGYDELGNLLNKRLTDGQTNSFHYDALNRLDRLNYFDGQVVTYTYTLNGRRYQAIDGRGTTTYGYDQRDRMTSIVQPGTAANALSIGYKYDENGNRTIMTTTVGASPATPIVAATNYSYNEANQLKQVNDPWGGQSKYSYDSVGNRSQLVLPNNITNTYGYDPINRLTGITQTNSTGIIGGYLYTLGAAGNRLSVSEAGGASYQWAYDDSYRLISETYKVSSSGPMTTTQYAYDLMGNRLSVKVGSNPATAYSYNSLDQVVTAGGINYYYDGRANLMRVGDGANATNYVWDAADRLTKATLPNGNYATYAYDSDGRRVQQTVVTSTTSTTNYLLDTQSQYADVVVETDGSGALQTSYVLGGPELLSQKKGATTSYFLRDGQGSTRALTNSSGAISESYSFDAFGKLQTGPATPNTNYLYTGQQFDVLSGLYSLRARYYTPGDGRFLSRDTWPVNFNNPSELNRYDYTANNPINSADPSGFAPQAVVRGSGGGLGESALLASIIQGFLYVGAATVGIATACLVIFDITSIMDAVGADSSIVPENNECKSKAPKCKAELRARFITTKDQLGVAIPLGAVHTYIVFTKNGVEETFNAGPVPIEGSFKLHTRISELGYLFSQKCEESAQTCSKYDKLVAYSNAVDKAGISYQILGPNSNSYTHGALNYSGIANKKPFWWIAPGWDTDLNVHPSI